MGVIALLSCRHFTEYGSSTPVPNPTGPEEECPEGCGWQLIEKEWKDKWHAVCNNAGCPYHTRHGFSKRYAVESAQRHQSRTGHLASVRWFNEAPSAGREQVAERSRQRRAKLLPETLPDGLAPPF